MQGGEPVLPAEQDYFDYSREDSVNFDVKHLTHTLCLSDVGDSAVLLLNPMVVWPDGEWEAWFFANWLPGASRYRSFGDWMRREMSELQDEAFEHTKRAGELPTVYLDGPGKSLRRVRAREDMLELPTVLERLSSKQNRERKKAAQQLSRLGGKPAIDALLLALKDDKDPEVRSEAAEALARLRASEAIESLIAAIDDPEVSTTAIHALAAFQDEESAQCLLKVLENGGLYATSAVDPLAQRGEIRAIPHLVRLLTSKNEADFHIGNIAGRLIARFGEEGYIALEPLITDPDVEIRRRVIAGVGDLAFCGPGKSLKIKSRELLQKLLETETDSELRRHLEISIEITTKKRI